MWFLLALFVFAIADDACPNVSQCNVTRTEGETCGDCLSGMACGVAEGLMFGVCESNLECYEGACRKPHGLSSFVPIKTLTEACDQNSERCCVQSEFGYYVLCNQTVCDGTCQYTAGTLESSASVAAPGGSCSAAGDHCPNGYECNAGACQIILQYVEQGQSCDGISTFCQNGLFCTNNICTAPAWQAQDLEEACDLATGKYCQGDKRACVNGVCKSSIYYSYYDNCNIDDPYGACPPGFTCIATGSNSSVFTCQRTGISQPGDDVAYPWKNVALGEQCGMGIGCSSGGTCVKGVCTDVVNFCNGPGRYVGGNGACMSYVNYDLFLWGTISGPLMVTLLVTWKLLKKAFCSNAKVGYV